ncbi:ABC transporter substrate-binding protein [Halomonas pacifica]|uniref:substrate-binding periplasmic protein n=1 Tax=Bisbaumannia pacifica TaxID=77098 RepID=UPI00235943F9|nr:ABC transporter substrate-binding protein [Halomonas pacifica]MDC8804069.1 ABC transporter substrate-binding protein [Halomonas pacifica]
MNQTATDLKLKVLCADLPAPPLFWRDDQGQRHGYEADVARLLGSKLAGDTAFVYRQWADFYPALAAGEGDILLCGQGISEYRRTLADFTAPYAVFDESVMVRRGSPIRRAEDLAGRRVGAIDKSLNMALAETFEGAIRVPFSGESEDVMGDMVAALRRGEIDAFVDDDVALVPLAEEEDLAIAFTVASRNAWGIAVKKGEPERLARVEAALAEVKANGELRALWERWMPTLDYPF